MTLGVVTQTRLNFAQDCRLNISSAFVHMHKDKQYNFIMELNK